MGSSSMLMLQKIDHYEQGGYKTGPSARNSKKIFNNRKAKEAYSLKNMISGANQLPVSTKGF